MDDTQAGFAPGTHFHYSNLGYRALGFVLEQVTGKPFPQALRSESMEPLGLDASEPAITHDIRERLAPGYSTTHFADRPVPVSKSPFPIAWFKFILPNEEPERA